MFVSSVIAATGTAYAAGVARVWRQAGVGQGVTRAQAAAFALGWLALVAAMLSRIDDLAETLFTAHMAQHELLMLVAAPLIALSSPLVAYLWMLPHAGRRAVMIATRGPKLAAVWTALTSPILVWLMHGLALWIWHMPALYDAALQNEAVHAVQHLCFFLTAALFWWGMAHGRYGRAGCGVAVVYVFATAIHSGVLGALLTFSPHVWFASYARSAQTLGLTPLEDQQLAGLLMWVPASLVFIAGGLYFFAAWLHESGRRTRSAFAPLVLVATVAIGASGCSSDPRAQFARTLDKAASWSASVQFAIENARAGLVPRAYIRDLLSTASDNVASLAGELDKAKDIPAAARLRAASTCRRLAALLAGAERAGTMPDAEQLRELEVQLRTSAQTARAPVAPRQTS